VSGNALPDVLGLRRAELAALLRPAIDRPYRVEQVYRGIYEQGAKSFDEITALSRPLRAALAERFRIGLPDVETKHVSGDGTTKYLFRLVDGATVEAVDIPDGERRTFCISSQAGCAMACRFCVTGFWGAGRDLTAGEIVGQVLAIAGRLHAQQSLNLVFMGMGEPLLNWPAVSTALTILNDPAGLGIGARHITVSTVGIVPGMLALAARPEQFRLAISLHAPAPGQRLRLMPIQKKYPMDEVLRAARAFRKRITFEYVLIAGKNDSDADADKLAKLAHGLGAHVNLLPLHPGGAPGLTPTSGNRIRAFADRLRHQGVEAVVRRSRGLDIDAACGQLFVAMEKKQRLATR